MRKLGSVIVVLCGIGLLSALYVATPYMMRTPSHVMQFLQVIAAGLVVGFGVVLLMAGVVMRGDKKAPRMPDKMPAPPKAAVDPALVDELANIQVHINLAREVRDETLAKLNESQRIEHLALALDSLMVMLKRRAGLK